MKTVTLKILRTRPTEISTYEKFRVPFTEETTVLDCLHYIRDNLDRTLSFRDTCRSGICGACGVMVNNKAYLACKTRVVEVSSGVLVIDPLRHFPVIRDLMVDFDRFFEELKRVSPWILADSAHEKAIDQEAVLKIRSVGHCVYCGVCYAESDLVEKDVAFPGPHAAAKVARYLEDPRERSEERMKIARTLYPFVNRDEKEWDLPCPTDIDFQEVRKILKEASK